MGEVKFKEPHKTTMLTEEYNRLSADSRRLDALLDTEGPFYIARAEQVKNLSFYGGMPDRATTRAEIDEVLDAD